MKKAILLLCLILFSISLTGCIKYGKGETVGYIYAVDDGIMWDKVWYKSDLQSSESDCYLMNTNAIDLKKELRDVSGKDIKVKLKYDRHFFTVGVCPEGTGTNDEITSYEIIE